MSSLCYTGTVTSMMKLGRKYSVLHSCFYCKYLLTCSFIQSEMLCFRHIVICVALWHRSCSVRKHCNFLGKKQTDRITGSVQVKQRVGCKRTGETNVFKLYNKKINLSTD